MHFAIDIQKIFVDRSQINNHLYCYPCHDINYFAGSDVKWLEFPTKKRKDKKVAFIKRILWKCFAMELFWIIYWFYPINWSAIQRYLPHSL